MSRPPREDVYAQHAEKFREKEHVVELDAPTGVRCFMLTSYGGPNQGTFSCVSTK